MKPNTLALCLGLYLLGYASAAADDIILRRLGKPACDDKTCRSDCSECPHGTNSSGDPCCVAPVTTTPPPPALTNPYCPSGETCFCQHDETVGCSYDQNCDVQVISPGTCQSGPSSGQPCTSDTDCPKGNGFATCSSASTTVTPGTCSRITSCCTKWCEQYGILGFQVGVNNEFNGDGSGFMKTIYCNDDGGTYRATCAATAHLQDHYTGFGVIGNVCNDPQNMYAPCESDNDFNGDGFQDVVAHHVAQGTWNNCELGEFTISGEITADGACHCSGTVSDGNGGADTFDGGVGTVPFTKELWHSGCGDNALNCGDPSYCIDWQNYECSAVFA